MDEEEITTLDGSRILPGERRASAEARIDGRDYGQRPCALQETATRNPGEIATR
jgi:hypothetical protein